MALVFPNLFYFQNITFHGQFVTGLSTFVGAVSGNLNTTLTNKPAGPPGKHFTKKQKDDLIQGIFHEGLLAKNRRRSLSELEIAELDLADAEDTLETASEYDRDDAEAAVHTQQKRVDTLRIAKAKKEAMDAARARWRQLIDKARGH